MRWPTPCRGKYLEALPFYPNLSRRFMGSFSDLICCECLTYSRRITITIRPHGAKLGGICSSLILSLAAPPVIWALVLPSSHRLFYSTLTGAKCGTCEKKRQNSFYESHQRFCAVVFIDFCMCKMKIKHFCRKKLLLVYELVLLHTHCTEWGKTVSAGILQFMACRTESM